MNIRRILREELYRQYNKNRNINYLIERNLHENINRLILNESQEAKSQFKAIKLAMQNGMDKERAEQFVRIDLRNDLSELRHSDTAKFTLGCTRLFFERQLTDAKSIDLLNQILGLITNKYYDKFDQNLNNLSMAELSEQFSQELEDIEAQNRIDVNSKEYVKQDYNIVPINSYKEAEEYNKYMYSKSPWCITYMDNMWENYTNDNRNQIYFCLKNGFENMEEPEETGNPKDEYGLSMISVIVDENSNLKYSTTRWNHANGASGDHDLTVQEISDIVGVNFYETFKPNGSFNDKLQEVLQRLNNGEDPKDVFDEINRIKDGFMLVKLSDRYNFIDTNGNILSRQWFYDARDFENGFAKVYLDRKWNFIDTNGNILSEQWFDLIYSFENGFAKVYLDGRWNFINTKGNIISNQWFDKIDNFYNGVAKVLDNSSGGWNFIDTNGNLFIDQWVDYIGPFENGIAKIKLNEKWNFIDTNGNIISNQWFDYVYGTKNGLTSVELDDKYYKIDTNGKLYNINI